MTAFSREKEGRPAVLPLLLVLAAAAGVGGCSSSSLPLERPRPVPFQPAYVSSAQSLAPGSGFADQAGGGVFVTAAGEAVRIRLDGTRAQLVSHPGNPVAPGLVRAVFRTGPRTALVEAEKGLFIADSGWMIAPSWRAKLGPGLVATAQTSDGAVWLAHTSGLYRLHEGLLTELKVGGESLTGITTLAAAPAVEDAAPGLWMLRDGQPSVAVALSANVHQVRPADIPLDENESLVSLVSLDASKDQSAELWALTTERILRLKDRRWRRVEFAQRPAQLLAAGRFLWVKSSDQLLSYDADADRWGEAMGVDMREFRFLAADESGCAWVVLGGQAAAISWGAVARVSGLYQGQKVVADGLVVRAIPPAGPAPAALLFQLGGADILSEGPTYSLGGAEADGTPRAFSFAALEPGMQSLSVVARFLDGSETRRVVHFDYQPVGAAVLSWEQNVRSIHESRCAQCHVSGPGRSLSTYAQWKENAELIVKAVRDQRMPADGPLDPQLINIIQRWASSGAKP
ncbi:hypothetical protein STIAU_8413 [Stigmatella aurantiaca DW4/3-1]|nr:hypothetical protein STIAU_8413 [Stigmatella aurantiaca DW4/3-1]